MPSRSVVHALSVLAGGAASASAAVPTEWEIELVCRSSLNPAIPAYRLPQGSSLSSQPLSLDETGGVAVRAVLSPSTGSSEGIFYGSPGNGGLVLSGSSVDPIYSPAVDVRNGRLAITEGGFTGGGAVYDLSGTLLDDYPPGGPLGTTGFSSPTLSDDGAYCYRADFGFLGDRLVVDEYIGGVRTPVNVADTFSGVYSFILTPRMNPSRLVVANTIPETGPSRRIVRFEPDGGGYSPVTIVESGPVFSGFVNSTGISGDGSVAFTGRRAADGLWQVTRHRDADGLTPIAEGGQDGINNSNLANFPPVVSDTGWVAFRVEHEPTDSTALFVGDGESLHRIVAAGDTLETDLGPITAGFDFGGTTGVQTINSNIDINDAGQIAFGAFLENGTVGIFLATPVPGCGPCPADLTGDCVLDIDDVLRFLGAFSRSNPEADLAAPRGVFNIDDVLRFLGAFAAGCP